MKLHQKRLSRKILGNLSLNLAARKWLYEKLTPGIKAGRSEFVLFDVDEIITEAKREKRNLIR